MVGAALPRPSSATAEMIGALKSIPVLTASAPMSSTTASIWAVATRGGKGYMSVTPTVLWVVVATIAVVP